MLPAAFSCTAIRRCQRHSHSSDKGLERRPLHPRVRRQAGFTLIELLVVVTIIGLLAAVGYPSYTRYVERSVRSDAHTGLLQAASTLERCHARRYAYAGCQDRLKAQSPEKNYTLTMSEADDSASGGYVLTAELSVSKADGCDEAMTLNGLGERSPAECW